MSIQNLAKTNNYKLFLESLKLGESNQSALDKYYFTNKVLNTAGALVTTSAYKATIIGKIVTISITIISGACTNNTSAITIQLENVIPYPSVNQYNSIRVQTDTGTLTNSGLIKIDTTGKISIFSNNTESSYFTLTNIIGLGYPSNSYFTFSYQIS